jgi:hypothetical protein
VPVLKGWELGYLCTDHKPDAKSGTLYYTLDLKLREHRHPRHERARCGRASVEPGTDEVIGVPASGRSFHSEHIRRSAGEGKHPGACAVSCPEEATLGTPTGNLEGR